jgi:hypothetical protein
MWVRKEDIVARVLAQTGRGTWSGACDIGYGSLRRLQAVLSRLALGCW